MKAAYQNQWYFPELWKIDNIFSINLHLAGTDGRHPINPVVDDLIELFHRPESGFHSATVGCDNTPFSAVIFPVGSAGSPGTGWIILIPPP